MKKIVIYIVEGASDEAALNASLKAHYADAQLRFKVIHADILTTRGNSPRNIKAKVGAVVNSYLKTYRLRKSDVQKLVHIIDTDGAFVDDSHVYYDDSSSLRYEEDGIYTDHTEKIRARNAQKKQNAHVLHNSPVISLIPYRMYYLSRDREHALMNKVDVADNMKMALADEYSEHYKGKLGEWKAHLRDPSIAVAGDYQQTWDFIMTGQNSLCRHSNLHLILGDT